MADLTRFTWLGRTELVWDDEKREFAGERQESVLYLIRVWPHGLEWVAEIDNGEGKIEGRGKTHTDALGDAHIALIRARRQKKAEEAANV